MKQDEKVENNKVEEKVELEKPKEEVKKEELEVKVEQSPTPASENNKRSTTIIMVLALFFLMTVSAAAYFGFGYWNLKGQMAAEEEKDVDTTPVAVTEKKEDKTKEVNSKSGEDEIENGEEGSELISVNNNWNKYINHDLAFEIKVPVEAMSYSGDCDWSEEDGDHSYRPLMAEVPVVVTEYSDGIYIDFEYRYELTDESTEGGITYYDDCIEEENDLAYLQEERRTWNIIVADVVDDDELEEFIQDRFGDGCNLGDQEETDDEGMFSVMVEGDGLPMEESECVLNYIYSVYYVPELEKVYTWDQGQSMKFRTDENSGDGLDEAMEESFKVLLE